MKFRKTVMRPYPPLFVSLFFEGFSKKDNWKQYIGFDYAQWDLICVDHEYLYPDYHMVDFPKQLMKELIKDNGLLDHIKKVAIENERKLIKDADKSFDKFYGSFIEYTPTLGFCWIMDDLIERKVKTLLKGFPQDMMDKLFTPLLDNFYILEKLSILNDPLEKHMKEFSWIRSRYGKIVPYPESDIIKMKKELIEEDYLDKYKKEKQDIKDAIKEAKKIVGEENEHFIDMLQFFIYYRTQRTDILNKAIWLAKDVIAEQAKKKGISYEDGLFCTHKELVGDIPPLEIIKQRKEGFTFVGKDGKYKVFVGKKHEEYVNKYLKVDQDIDEIKGRPAFQGKIEGKVKIVRSMEDLKDVKEGDILVTSMTTPNMITAMEKAAAFVTNEGGITCHAAIVSREMKKPCIIGTKIATKVLKDGDIVEVDAENGILRKIN